MPDPSSPTLPRWLRSASVAWGGLALALLIVVLTAAFLLHEAQALERGEIQGAELYARVLRDQGERTFDTVDIAMAALADSIGASMRHGDTHRFERDLPRVLNGLPFLRSLSVMDARGRVLASSSPANVGVEVDTRVVRLPAPGAIDVLGSSVDGRDLPDAGRGRAAAASPARTFVPLVRAVGNATGEPLYLVAVLNPQFFGNEYELLLADGARSAALFSIDAVLLAGTGNLRMAPGQRARDHRFFTRFLPGRESGSAVGPGIDGNRVVTAFRVMRKRPWVVVVERPWAQALAGFHQTLFRALGVSGGALLLVAALLGMAWRSLKGNEAAQRALQAQLAFTARLLDVGPTPIFVKDDQGRFVTVNRAWLDLMNLELPEVLGRGSADLFASDAARHQAQDDRLLGSEERISYDDRLHVHGRPPRETVVTKVRFRRADGTPAGIVGSIVDVTEFREAERTSRRARDAAQSANGAKSAFIADISHELRTPLQGILGFSEIGLDISADRPDVLDLFTDIHAGGQRMLTLVNGLLDVSQMESVAGALPLERVDVALLVRDAVGQLQPEVVLRELRMCLAGLAEPVEADVDRVRFQQAVCCVVANAVRYSPVGATIEVSLNDRGASGIEIRVRDHGPGIPTAELELIFDAFVQSSRTRDGSGGTGLGLTIARKIMGAHGGSVAAANVEGGGALFSLLLPAAGVCAGVQAEPPWPDATGRRMAAGVR